MGNRGPPKKPTHLKLAQGVPGGKHKLNLQEPKPDLIKSEKKIAPPYQLTKEQRKVWDEVTKVLVKMKVLSSADTYTLARYCEMTVMVRSMKKKIGLKHTVQGTNSAGGEYEIVNPLINTMTGLCRDLLRIEQQFGMTPAARANLKEVQPDTPETIEGQLFG